MRPKKGTTVYRPDLGAAILEAGTNPSAGNIGLRILPPYTTPDDSATFLVVPMEAVMGIENVDRSDRGAYNRSDWDYEDGWFKCREKGHEEPMDDNEYTRLERRMPGLADRIATGRAMNFILRAQEKRIAERVMDPNLFDVKNVGAKYTDQANCTPITDFNDAKSDFRKQCGMLPNCVVMSWTTRKNIVQSQQIIDRLIYTFPGIDLNQISDVQLAAILDVPQILVGNIMYNTADKGQNFSLSDIWSDNYILLTRVSASEDLSEPCIGRTFIWTEDNNENPIVETYREEQIRSDVYRVRHSIDESLLRSFDENGNIVSDISKGVTLLMGNIK